MLDLRFTRFLLALLAVFSFSGTLLAQYSSQPSTNLPSHLPSETRRATASVNGQVVLEDGTPVREPVEIFRVCGSMTRRETYTNAKGKFSIIFDENSSNNTFQGASQGGGTADFGAQMGSRVSGTTRTQLWGCEIRASLPGYTSNAVSLAGMDFSTPVTLAPIVLRKSSGAEGASLSVISAKAPENARKEFDKGREEFQKKNYKDAEKHLAKAVEIYPEYSSAWDMLGRGQRLMKEDEAAAKSFQTAISVDEKFVPPYIQLAGLNASRANWPEVVRLTGKVIELDPISFPDAYFLNAFGYFNMNQLAEAESSAGKAVALDKQHRFPRAELLFAKILQSRGDNLNAAEHFRNFLKMEPSSPEAPSIQAFLTKVERENPASGDASKPN